MSVRGPVTRTPGWLYLLMGAPAVFALQYVPARFYVTGDAAATAARITAAVPLYRFGILCDLASNVAFLLLGLSLYDVFRDVDRRQARSLLTFVAVAVAIGFVNALNSFAPLILLGGAPYLSVIGEAQRQALALGFLRLHGAGIAFLSVFWGLWLFPFGVLVVRSGFLPKWLGYCLLAGGVSYLVFGATYLALPASLPVVSKAVLPFYAIGELPIALWLVVAGVRARPMEARLAA